LLLDVANNVVIISKFFAISICSWCWRGGSKKTKKNDMFSVLLLTNNPCHGRSQRIFSLKRVGKKIGREREFERERESCAGGGCVVLVLYPPPPHTTTIQKKQEKARIDSM
jgi:hypothetical protein